MKGQKKALLLVSACGSDDCSEDDQDSGIHLS